MGKKSTSPFRPRIGAASDKVIRCASVPGCLICFGEAWSDSNDSRLIDRHGNPRIFANGTEQVHTLTGRSNHMFVDAVQSSPDASARGRLRRHQALKVIDLNDGNRNRKRRISEFEVWTPFNEIALLPSRFRMSLSCREFAIAIFGKCRVLASSRAVSAVHSSCREFAIAIFGKCRVLASSRAVSAVHSRSRTRRASLCSRGHLYDFLLNGESDQLRFVMDFEFAHEIELVGFHGLYAQT